MKKNNRKNYYRNEKDYTERWRKDQDKKYNGLKGKTNC